MIKGRLPSEIIEEVLPVVEQFVEATAFERLALWKEWNTHCDWVGIGMGLGCAVGKHETMIMFWFAHINDKLIAFYEPTSSVVYWDDVDDFIRSFGKPKTNATNYHPLK
jgi:hypothetical protein